MRIREALKGKKLSASYIAAGVILLLSIGAGLYTYFTRSSTEIPKHIVIKPPQKKLSEEGDKKEKTVAKQLPGVQEAEKQQKEALIEQGRYVAPVPVSAVGVQPNRMVRRTPRPQKAVSDRRAKIVAAMWKDVLREDKIPGGGLLGKKEKQEETQEKTEEQKEAFPSFVPFYEFVKAVLRATSSSLHPNYPVIAEITDTRFPRGTILVGRPYVNKSAYRIEVAFNKMRLPDGRSYEVTARAFSIDESPGIASLVERRDIVGGALSSVFAGLKGFAEAMRKDESTVVVTIGGDTIGEETRKDDNRLREGALAGSEEAMAKAEQIFDKEMRRDMFKEEIIAEKALPILVVFYEK